MSPESQDELLTLAVWAPALRVEWYVLISPIPKVEDSVYSGSVSQVTRQGSSGCNFNKARSRRGTHCIGSGFWAQTFFFSFFFFFFVCLSLKLRSGFQLIKIITSESAFNANPHHSQAPPHPLPDLLPDPFPKRDWTCTTEISRYGCRIQTQRSRNRQLMRRSENADPSIWRIPAA